MNSLRISVRRAGSVFAALALVLSTALPGIVSAAQVTERSIALSTSAADADAVSYEVKFTTTQAAGAVVIDFCSDSPLLGSECTPPAGFTLASATAAGFTKDAASNANKIVLVGSVANGANTITLAGVNNPTAAGSLFARIITFTADTGAIAYDSEAPGTHLDDGGVAMSITPTIAVSGAVLESMLFCVSGGQAPEENCDLTDPAVTAPTLKLGQDTGGVVALDAQNLSEGTIYTQLSTNAAGGAVVSLKSNTVGCGGLSRQGAASFAAGCGIVPANSVNTAGAFGVAAGQARFGLKLGTAVGVGTSNNGTYQIYGTGGSPYYSTSLYKLNAFTDNSAGVTSTYGDPILDTNNLPLNNMNMPITFGASAANNTPAGNYQANLSLIATGKF